MLPIVAFNRTAQIKKTVLAEAFEHVVKKSDWITYIADTSSIKIQSKLNFCFASNSFYSSRSHFYLLRALLFEVRILQYPLHQVTAILEEELVLRFS